MFDRSSSPPLPPPAIAFLGTLRSDFILLPDHSFHQNLMGGGIAFAAAGAHIWSSPAIALAAKISRDYPKSWLEACARLSWDLSAVRSVATAIPFTNFFTMKYGEWRSDLNPQAILSKIGSPTPLELMEYIDPGKDEGDLHCSSEAVLRPMDLPRPLREVSAAYVGSCHLRSQMELSHALREAGVSNILLSLGHFALTSLRSREIETLLHGVSMVYLTEDSVRQAAKSNSGGEDADGWMTRLIRMGAHTVLIQRGQDGVLMMNHGDSKAAFFPFYPTTNRNPIGIGDAFCGGFLNAWIGTYDLRESVLRGCVSASIAAEGFGALYATECHPLLAASRLQSLRRILHSA